MGDFEVSAIKKVRESYAREDAVLEKPGRLPFPPKAKSLNIFQSVMKWRNLIRTTRLELKKAIMRATLTKKLLLQ